jgi:hypothetical protein
VGVVVVGVIEVGAVVVVVVVVVGVVVLAVVVVGVNVMVVVAAGAVVVLAVTGAGPPKSSQSGSLDMTSWAARPRPDESTMTISDPLPVAPAAGVGCPKVLTEPAVVKFMSGATPMPVVIPFSPEK